jgi:hypothetical protein
MIFEEFENEINETDLSIFKKDAFAIVALRL